MTFTLTFTHVDIDGGRIPSIDERGQEVKMYVEASDKTATFFHTDVVSFCATQGNDTRIREVR